MYRNDLSAALARAEAAEARIRELERKLRVRFNPNKKEVNVKTLPSNSVGFFMIILIMILAWLEGR